MMRQLTHTNRATVKRRGSQTWLGTGRHGKPRNTSKLLGHVGHIGLETRYFCAF